MANIIWRSKQKVAGKNNRIGHLVIMDNDEFRVEFPDGTYEPFPKYLGKRLHAREKTIQIGRPGLFESEDVEAHTITLPKRVWDKLEQPYSKSIFDIITK